MHEVSIEDDEPFAQLDDEVVRIVSEGRAEEIQPITDQGHLSHALHKKKVNKDREKVVKLTGKLDYLS